MTRSPVRVRARVGVRLLVGSLAALVAVAGAGVPALAPGAAAAATPAVTTTVAASSPSSSSTASSPWCTADAFTQAQQTVESDLANRVTQLDTLLGRTDAATGLTPSDKSTLLADITQTELPGIQALQRKVPADTLCVELRQDARSMVDDYRVYLVMTPQTDLVITTDATGTAEGFFAGLEPVVSGWIAYAGAHGKDVSGAQAAFADYEAKVSAAQGLTSGQSATLLAQTPAGAPANLSVFLQARANVSNARNDLHAARSDLAQIITDIG